MIDFFQIYFFLAAGTFPLNFSKLNNSSSNEIDLMKYFPTKETPKCNQESSEKQKSEKLKRSERHKMVRSNSSLGLSVTSDFKLHYGLR